MVVSSAHCSQHQRGANTEFAQNICFYDDVLMSVRCAMIDDD